MEMEHHVNIKKEEEERFSIKTSNPSEKIYNDVNNTVHQSGHLDVRTTETTLNYPTIEGASCMDIGKLGGMSIQFEGLKKTSLLFQRNPGLHFSLNKLFKCKRLRRSLFEWQETSFKCRCLRKKSRTLINASASYYERNYFDSYVSSDTLRYEIWSSYHSAENSLERKPMKNKLSLIPNAISDEYYIVFASGQTSNEISLMNSNGHMLNSITLQRSIDKLERNSINHHNSIVVSYQNKLSLLSSDEFVTKTPPVNSSFLNYSCNNNIVDFSLNTTFPIVVHIDAENTLSSWDYHQNKYSSWTNFERNIPAFHSIHSLAHPRLYQLTSSNKIILYDSRSKKQADLIIFETSTDKLSINASLVHPTHDWSALATSQWVGLLDHRYPNSLNYTWSDIHHQDPIIFMKWASQESKPNTALSNTNAIISMTESGEECLLHPFQNNVFQKGNTSYQTFSGTISESLPSYTTFYRSWHRKLYDPVHECRDCRFHIPPVTGLAVDVCRDSMNVFQLAADGSLYKFQYISGDIAEIEEIELEGFSDSLMDQLQQKMSMLVHKVRDVKPIWNFLEAQENNRKHNDNILNEENTDSIEIKTEELEMMQDQEQEALSKRDDKDVLLEQILMDLKTPATAQEIYDLIYPKSLKYIDDTMIAQIDRAFCESEFSFVKRLKKMISVSKNTLQENTLTHLEKLDGPFSFRPLSQLSTLRINKPLVSSEQPYETTDLTEFLMKRWDSPQDYYGMEEEPDWIHKFLKKKKTTRKQKVREYEAYTASLSQKSLNMFIENMSSQKTNSLDKEKGFPFTPKVSSTSLLHMATIQQDSSSSTMFANSVQPAFASNMSMKKSSSFKRQAPVMRRKGF